MTSSAAEVQRAVYLRLTQDATLGTLLGGGKIYDHAPAHAAFPYLTFGRGSSFDWSTATEPGAEELFTINAWSKGNGRKELLAIMARVETLLDDAPLTLEGHHLVGMRLEASETRYDDDIAVHRGVLRFRAVTERLA